MTVSNEDREAAACKPDCGYEPGHIDQHPCGQPHIPGSPCNFCEKPTPSDGSPCPDCWTPLREAIADIKALFARNDLGLIHRIEGGE